MIAVATLFVLVLIYLYCSGSFSVLGLQSLIRKAQAPAFFILLAVYCVKSVVMVIPAAALYVTAGMLFPIGKALAVTWAGLLLEITISYLIGRRIGLERALERLSKNRYAARILTILEHSNRSTCFLTRILPVPIDLGSIYFGAIRMPWWEYALFSLLGLSPKMLPYVLAGREITNPLSREFLIPFGVSIAISCSVFVFFRFYEKKTAQKRTGKSEDALTETEDEDDSQIKTQG